MFRGRLVDVYLVINGNVCVFNEYMCLFCILNLKKKE